MMGVPLHFWAEPTFRSIREALCDVKLVDLDGGRVQICLDGFKPLTFETTVEFHSGDEATVILRYERLHGFCRHYFSLCYDIARCPILFPPREQREEQKRTGDKGDRGAMSYKSAAAKDSSGSGYHNLQGSSSKLSEKEKGKGKMGDLPLERSQNEEGNKARKNGTLSVAALQVPHGPFLPRDMRK